MKTTLEISDAIFLRAKSVAAAENSTLRSLMEEGLSKVLLERDLQKPFSVKPVTFKLKFTHQIVIRRYNSVIYAHIYCKFVDM